MDEFVLLIGTKMQKNKVIIPYYIIYDRGSYSIKEENVFNSREEAIKIINERSQKQVEDFISQIDTIEDLVVFMYNHNVCVAEEYTDWEAREAAKIKAEEFGIELERK